MPWCSLDNGGEADGVRRGRWRPPGVGAAAQLRGDALVAGAAQGGEGVQAIEVPAAMGWVAPMMGLKVVGAVAGAATVAVTCEDGDAQRLPAGAGEVCLVCFRQRHCWQVDLWAAQL